LRIYGYLLDLQVQNNQVSLWIKGNGKRIRFLDKYYPDFFIQPKGIKIQDLYFLLDEQEHIESVKIEEKRKGLKTNQIIKVLRVKVNSVKKYRSIIRKLETSGYVENIFDDEITHTQRYLCDRGLIPFCEVIVDADGKNNLRSIETIKIELDPKPPPFGVLCFQINWKEGCIEVFDPWPLGEDAVFEIGEFVNYLHLKDPDILACTGKDLFDLIKFTQVHKLEKFGIISGNGFKLWRGRIHLPLRTYLSIGLAGISERVWYTRESTKISASWGSGRAIESRQCYEARSNHILIPRSGDFQPIMTLNELIKLDQGGLIFTPDIGIHENVAVLDFDSMFPSLMVSRNLSYETIRDRTNEGFLVDFTHDTLNRRLFFKKRRCSLNPDSDEYAWCDGRQGALKSILFCTYGYSGCWANRFGNFDTFMEINRIARNILVQSMNVARNSGFKTLYGNNDSLFLHKENAVREDYESLSEEISEKVSLPMSLNYHFRYLVLLPQKNDQDIGAANRYYGRTYEGKYIHRGIELRRRNTPPFVARVQTDIIKTLLEKDSLDKIRNEGVREALHIIDKACRRIQQRQVPLIELGISTFLRKKPEDYKARLPHVTAAEALKIGRMPVKEKTMISYVFVDANHSNAFRRVRPSRFGQSYDIDKYKELIRDAGKSVLRPFEVDNYENKEFEQISLNHFY